MKKPWTIYIFHATIRPNSGRLMKSAPPNKEVVATKIGLKKFKLTINLQLTLKVDLRHADGNFLLNLGTFLATLWCALKA